jgi:calcium-dependent protein kinase
MDLILQEIGILSSLDHPNIIKYHETYQSAKYMYLVMEFCGGGELFDKLTSNNKTFSEASAADIMETLFLAVNHCHHNKVAHRDLKPENIMYSESGKIKLIDFGLSKRQKGQGQLDTMVGTPYYVAPEVLEGRYGFECDLWSLGVIMYILLSGYLPFSGKATTDVFQKIKDAKVEFKQKEWVSVSKEAKDLIRKLICKDINK